MANFAHIDSTTRGLTLARLDAVIPRMIELRVAGISAFVVPSTAFSTAAKFAGFFQGATLGTRI